VASIPPPPRAIGPYILEELLGHGGMAEVYRARREGPGGFEKVFALKRILPSYARNPTLVQRFESEAKTISRLNHPHICTLYDVGREGATDYLVMELVEGATLAERIARGAMPITEVQSGRLGVMLTSSTQSASAKAFVNGLNRLEYLKKNPSLSPEERSL